MLRLKSQSNSTQITKSSSLRYSTFERASTSKSRSLRKLKKEEVLKNDSKTIELKKQQNKTYMQEKSRFRRTLTLKVK